MPEEGSGVDTEIAEALEIAQSASGEREIDLGS